MTKDLDGLIEAAGWILVGMAIITIVACQWM